MINSQLLWHMQSTSAPDAKLDEVIEQSELQQRSIDGEQSTIMMLLVNC